MKRRRKSKKKYIKIKLSPFAYFMILLFLVYLALVYNNNIANYVLGTNRESNIVNNNSNNKESDIVTLDNIPEYTGSPYIVINNNEPYFESDEINTTSFEKYSDLDSLNRCGVAYANVSKDTMPTKKRESIGMVKPSGWHTVKYDIVEGKYLYNRCHLIGYQLTGENANEKNLITCTRYMNNVGMLYFEDLVAEYVKETNNHVLYRVTPIYDGNNLVASGVLMEAYSVEDKGDGIKFNVYVFNVQKGIVIDYKTGDSHLE